MNLQELAESKGFSVSELEAFGLYEDGDRVAIPFLTGGECHELFRTKYRDKVEDGEGFLWDKNKDLGSLPYGLNRPVPIDKYVYIVEGESDCWALWCESLPCIGIPGATNTGCLKLEHVLPAQVAIVIQEPGEAGERFPHRVALKLYDEGFQGKVYSLRLPGFKDPREARNKAQNGLREVLREAWKDKTFVERPRSLEAKKGQRTIRTRALSSFTPEPLKWLWNQRIPEGKISLLVGDGGDGKSFATLGIASCVTQGFQLPGGSTTEPGYAIFWNGEDTPEDTIYIRAEQAGADLDRIKIVEETDEDGKLVPFNLKDVPLLAQEIEATPGTKLVVIDPITALLGDINTWRDSDLRSALQPLVDLARKTGAAIVLVMHLKKGSEGTILHKVSGSIAFGALARSVLYLGMNSINGRRGIDTIKHNLANGRPEPVEFALTEEGFSWVGLAPDLTAENIIKSKTKAIRGDSLDEAVRFLNAFLEGGPQPSNLVESVAKSKGISISTLKRAKDHLDVRARKGTGERGTWTWELDPETIALSKGYFEKTDQPVQQDQQNQEVQEGDATEVAQDDPDGLLDYADNKLGSKEAKWGLNKEGISW